MSRTDPNKPTKRSPEPFIRWVGGKRRLFKHLWRFMPPKFGTYYEPFLGSGAVYFALQSPKAVLSDNNQDLINAWLGVRENPKHIYDRLQEWPVNREFFNNFRDNVRFDTLLDQAAWFIYINLNCFNGLWRVRLTDGKPNTPFAVREKNSKHLELEKLEVISKALQTAQILCGDFETALTEVKFGDFVFLDPPYFPPKNNPKKVHQFLQYCRNTILPQDHTRIRDLCLTMRENGVYVVQTNSYCEEILELYKDFKIAPINVTRSINPKHVDSQNVEVVIY